jgi:hypothetical protein
MYQDPQRRGPGVPPLGQNTGSPASGSRPDGLQPSRVLPQQTTPPPDRYPEALGLKQRRQALRFTYTCVVIRRAFAVPPMHR